MTRQEVVVLVVCLTAGALVGFSLTADAALGTAAGAALWLLVDQRLRHHPR